MTVTCHVNELKISHKDKKEVTNFIGKLQNIYGMGITIACGKIHSYLGMDFDLSEKNVKLSIIK